MQPDFVCVPPNLRISGSDRQNPFDFRLRGRQIAGRELGEGFRAIVRVGCCQRFGESAAETPGATIPGDVA